MDDKPRKKVTAEIYKQYYAGLSSNMKGFLDEAYNSLGIQFNITSGKREPKGRFSHHHKGDAIDFDANQFEHYNKLYNTKEGLTLLSKYNLGIIDETDPRMLAKTKGTGAHFHIGMDANFYKKVKERVNTTDIVYVPSFQERVHKGESVESILADGMHYEGDGHNHSEEFFSSTYKPQDFMYREYEKEIIRADKEEKDPIRAELAKTNEEEKTTKSIQEEFLSMMNNQITSANIDNLMYSNMQEQPPIEEVNLNQYIQQPSQFIFST